MGESEQAFRTVYDEVRAERERAHRKHGDTSMESQPILSHRRASILTEEVGEVAKILNDVEHGLDFGSAAPALRAELIQVAAMAVAWAEAVEGRGLS